MTFHTYGYRRGGRVYFVIGVGLQDPPGYSFETLPMTLVVTDPKTRELVASVAEISSIEVLFFDAGTGRLLARFAKSVDDVTCRCFRAAVSVGLDGSQRAARGSSASERERQSPPRV
jgi:hypothetical protein